MRASLWFLNAIMALQQDSRPSPGVWWGGGDSVNHLFSSVCYNHVLLKFFAIMCKKAEEFMFY